MALTQQQGWFWHSSRSYFGISEDLSDIKGWQFGTIIFTLTLGGAMIANMVFGVFVAKVHDDLLTSRMAGKKL